MGPTEADTAEWKRLVTTEGRPVGWARRGEREEWHARPNPGLLRGCDSWITPSWHEDARYTLDADAVVGEGDATVVLDVDGTAEPLLDRSRTPSDDRAPSTDRSGSAHERPPGTHR